jgi:hypothetical protein
MGSAVTNAVEGLGSIFQGTGKLLLQPLVLIPNLLTKGFSESVHQLQTNTQEGAKQVQKGAQETTTSIFQMGEVLGNVLSSIGSLIGGSAGKILNVIGTVISTLSEVASLIVSAIWGKVTILGFGQTGGYFENGGLTRPTGVTAGRESVEGTIGIHAHPGEGLINPGATDWLGGRDAIMSLNRREVPPSIVALAASGIRVNVPALPSLGRGSAGGPGLIDQSITVGDIHVTAPAGADGEQFGRALWRGMITEFGR